MTADRRRPVHGPCLPRPASAQLLEDVFARVHESLLTIRTVQQEWVADPRATLGSQVFIIGAPLDLGHTLTVGHVSARRKEESFLGSMRFIEHFQTDAAINKGNSGGPMFDMRGNVVGIVCHIVTQSGANEGLGFVVTSHAVREHFLDHPVSTPEGLNQAIEAIGALEPGQELRLVVLRSGMMIEVRGPLDD